MVWRRLDKSDTWHFIRTCSNWPKGHRIVPGKKGTYHEQETKPTTGELCNQCLAKLAARAKKLPVKHHATWAEQLWAWWVGVPLE